jgi:hypothetical protein
MTEQSENGSGVTAPQANISASEGGVPSEVKTSENKSSEGALKGAELLLAIIGIVKLVIDLLKKGSKDSEAFTQIQASNQNIQPEILQNIIEKTAKIFANANIEKNPIGVEESKDPVKALESKILESLGLDPKKMGVEDKELQEALKKYIETLEKTGDNKKMGVEDKELQEALKKYIETLEKTGDKINGATKLPATKENEEGAKDLNNTVGGKEAGVKVNKALSAVSSESKKVSNEGVQGQKAGSFSARVMAERQYNDKDIGGRG